MYCINCIYSEVKGMSPRQKCVLLIESYYTYTFVWPVVIQWYYTMTLMNHLVHFTTIRFHNVEQPLSLEVMKL